MALRSVVEERGPAYVSTGHLPDADTVQSLVTEAQRRFQSNRDETNNAGLSRAGARSERAVRGLCRRNQRAQARASACRRRAPRPCPRYRRPIMPLQAGVNPLPAPLRSRLAVRYRHRAIGRRHRRGTGGVGAGSAGGIVAAVIADGAGDKRRRMS